MDNKNRSKIPSAFNIDYLKDHTLIPGQLGGKTRGLFNAYQLLKKELTPNLSNLVNVPISYFIGSDEFDHFVEINQLQKYQDSKSRTHDGYLSLIRDFEKADLSKQLSSSLEILLNKFGEMPLIIRSSSILEDQFGASFAGIYKSVFCPNQGLLKERITQLETGIKQIYASTFSPNAIGYRESKGFSTYSEKMAILIQAVDGQLYQNFFFPTIGGVAFSQNPYCWSDRLNQEDGFIRLVWGLGTQAVNTKAGNYPRLIGLTNPELRPEGVAQNLSYYSQHYLDVIDIEDRSQKTVKITNALLSNYPSLQLIASKFESGGFNKLNHPPKARDNLIISFDGLIKGTPFIEIVKRSLEILSDNFGQVISIEFSANLESQNDITLNLLQCRRLPWENDDENRDNFNENQDEIILRTDRFLSGKKIREIKNVVYIDPKYYSLLSTAESLLNISEVISKLNKHFESDGYILVGPGRWGSQYPEMGIPVQFSDIYNAKLLVEIHDTPKDLFSATYGTHFFMDLVEMNISLLAIDTNDDNTYINYNFFQNTNNLIEDIDDRGSIIEDGIMVQKLPISKKIKMVSSLKNRVAFAYIRTHN